LYFSGFGFSPFFLGWKDEKWGEKLVMVLEGSGIDQHEIKKLMEDWSRFQDHKKLPKAVYQVEKFPRTPSLKIKKPELKSLISSQKPVWEKI
jgi:acyl-coenzyme A synthetase/AMP-(fatty) acid ligase